MLGHNELLYCSWVMGEGLLSLRLDVEYVNNAEMGYGFNWA